MNISPMIIIFLIVIMLIIYGTKNSKCSENFNSENKSNFIAEDDFEPGDDFGNIMNPYPFSNMTYYNV